MPLIGWFEKQGRRINSFQFFKAFMRASNEFGWQDLKPPSTSFAGTAVVYGEVPTWTASAQRISQARLLFWRRHELQRIIETIIATCATISAEPPSLEITLPPMVDDVTVALRSEVQLQNFLARRLHFHLPTIDCTSRTVDHFDRVSNGSDNSERW